MKIRYLINQYGSLIYFLLAFILSWGLVIILAGTNNLPIDAEKSKDLLPLLYTAMLVGPVVGGLLLIGLSEGKNGFTNLISHLFKWRVRIQWYAVALLATPIIATLLLFILSIFSPEFQINLFKSENVSGLLLNGIIVGIMVGIFEEIGWTGFVIPRLLHHNSIFKTGLIVGLLWGFWHFILFWENESFFGALPFLILIGRLFSWLPPFRILMVWIYNRTKSLLLVILTHLSLVVTTTVIVPMTLAGTGLLIWLLVWSLLLWFLAFIVLRLDQSKLQNTRPIN